MRRISIGCLLAVFLLSGGGVAEGNGKVRKTGSEKRTLIALDLMDLDIPGEGGGDQMDLPPIQETERPAEVTEPPAPQSKPEEEDLSRTNVPEPRSSDLSTMPGMAPFLLEEAGDGLGTTRAETGAAEGPSPEALLQEVPVELKTVPPPPSRAESLKLPSGLDGGASSGGTAVPEIPLLKDEDSGPKTPVAGGQESPLTMKPFSGLQDAPVAGRNFRPSREGRRLEDYLQVREEIDARLIEIYERYYRDR
jgi:hypothetical protein